MTLPKSALLLAFAVALVAGCGAAEITMRADPTVCNQGPGEFAIEGCVEVRGVVRWSRGQPPPVPMLVGVHGVGGSEPIDNGFYTDSLGAFDIVAPTTFSRPVGDTTSVYVTADDIRPLGGGSRPPLRDSVLVNVTFVPVGGRLVPVQVVITLPE